MAEQGKLKLNILIYLDRFGSDSKYKYNLTGRDAPGELELWLGETWTKQQRLAADHAIEGLKSEGLVQSTMSGNDDPDNWIAITDSGREAVKRVSLFLSARYFHVDNNA